MDVYNGDVYSVRVQPHLHPSRAVSGLLAALSRRGRQRGRLPRARGRQDRQGGAQLQALGGRRGAALQYIQPSLLYMCTAARIVYTIPLITGIHQIAKWNQKH